MSKDIIEGVAVVGMAGRFPGADSVEEFWKNLQAGADSITSITDEQLIAEGVDEALLSDPSFVKRRGLFSSPEMFDARFFGISPREAELMDPQQRVFLETCWHAMENAGYAPGKCEFPIGVWGGMSTGMKNNTYLLSNIHGNPAVTEEDSLAAMLGNENDYLTTRVSYKLNLGGPSVNVQSACSTSLVAITNAFQSLMTYGCDMAMAGGVSVSYPQHEGYLFQEGDIASPDGHCRPFDSKAQGTVFSNGVGVVVLKRVEDAIEDGDTIYAVIRGAALNNDGSSKVSFAAPSVDGQAKVIAMAQAIADVDPETVTYVECHGTGTPIGDPIEIAGLTKAFGLGPDYKSNCGLGSVKSNMGHLDSAAGVTSFIKTVLCLYHKTLVPTVHFNNPHSNIKLGDGPFYICDETKDWQTKYLPRRAGVSGFGIGGTNAHLVLEEYESDNTRGVADATSPELLVFSAKHKGALQDLLDCYAYDTELENHGLADIAHTLRVGREDFSFRAVTVAKSVSELKKRIVEKDSSLFAMAKNQSENAEKVFMFSGGGSQYLNMGADIYRNNQLIRDCIDEGLNILATRHGVDLKPVWFTDNASEENEQLFMLPSSQLPAILILEVALSRWWISKGVEPQALIGHSMGEYAAACISGVLSLEDGIGLVLLRGQLFETIKDSGMLSVTASVEELQPYLNSKYDIATINSAETCTISGTRIDLDKLLETLNENDIDAQLIPIGIAAHSRLLDPILPAYKSYLDKIQLNAPTIPLLSNLTGTWMTDQQAQSPQYWVDHLRNTVRFADCVGCLLDEKHVYIEVGPGKILGSLVRLQAPGEADSIVPSLRHHSEKVDDNEFLLATVGRLWCAGVALDLQQFGLPAIPGRRIPLPGYKFQRKSYFVAPASKHLVTGEAAGEVQLPSTSLMEHAALLQNSLMQTAAVAAEPTMPSQESEKMPAVDRKDYIKEKLADTIENMSGMDREEIEVDVSFLDMGFDSLFLTQANLKFKKEFGVKITFRQLFEDAPTIAALAEYIDKALPENALQDQLQPVESAEAVTSVPADTPAMANVATHPPITNMTAVGGVTLNQALALQLQASNAIISLLTGAPPVGLPSAPQSVATSAPIDKIASSSESEAQALPKHMLSKVVEKVEAKGFGPYRPLDTSKGKLNDEARISLNEFIKSYADRTSGSKKIAEEQRGHLSDARSISGFRLDWKEAVYQIVGAGSKGSKVWDIDGNEYIDVTSGFGCNLMGYSLDPVVKAIKEQVDKGFELGTLSPLAKEAADIIHDLTGMDRVTFTNTGSEALSAAVRAARAITGKDKIAVFYDEYHGIADELLVNIQRSKKGRRTVPTSPGIPQFLVENVIVLEWDDPHYMDILRENADDLAALIIEPVQNRNPALKTNKEFSEIRKLTKENNIALVFDEMITGFRLHPGGAQAYFGIEVDMCCYGKIVSAGMSLAVLAGRGEWLDCFDGGPWQFGDDSFPEAGVIFFGGTYTRHPIALAGAVAGLKMIQQLKVSDYEALNQKSLKMAHQLNEFLVGNGFPARFESRGSIFNLKFNDDNPFTRLIFWFMRHKGILIYDRPFFISMAHNEAEINQFKQVVEESVLELQATSIVPKATIDNYYGGINHVAFSEAQQEVWLATLLSQQASKAFHEQIIYEMHEVLDIDALRYAVQKVIYRHEALRATVSEEKEGLAIHPALHMPVEYVDLTGQVEVSEAFDKYVQHHIDQEFDLNNGPLLRFSLVKTAPQISSIVIAAHHIVIDGWSMGVLLEDLAGYYGEAIDGNKFGSSAVNQLSGVNVMMAEQLASAESREAEDFWLKQYQGELPAPPALKLDFVRPKVKTYNGHRIVRQIDSDLLNAIKKLNTNSHCTMFTSMFSVFCIWLQKITTQDDLVIGVPVAGQALWGCSDMVGHSVSYLPFRMAVDSHASYEDFLATVRNYVLDANENQNFTYGSLLKKLAIVRDPGQLPLTSIAFNVDQGMLEFDFGGVNARYVPCPRNFVKYDIFFNVVDEGNGISLEVDFNSDLFKQETIEVWLDQFQQLLSDVISSPQSKIQDISLNNKSVEAQLESFNNTDKDYQLETKTLHGLIEHTVDRYPDNVAVQDDNSKLSFKEFDSRANQLAHYLIEKGVGSEKLVAICMDRSVEMVVAIVAVLKAGGAYIPIDPMYPSDRISLLLNESGAICLLSQEIFVETLPGNIDTLLVDKDWTKVEGKPVSRPAINVKPDDMAYVIYTSGSTGKPKGVMVGHRGVCNRMLWMQDAFDLSENDIVLQKTPYTFDVSVWEIFCPLFNGAKLVMAAPGAHVDSQQIVEVINRYQITIAHFVPSMLSVFLLNDEAASCQSLRYVICSGEALSYESVNGFYSALPATRLYNLYGPTEASIEVTAWECNEKNESNIVPIGRPIANTQIYILDENQQSVPVGGIGELYIGGVQVARGYLNQPELTAEKFQTVNVCGKSRRIYRSGDLARFREDGAVEYLGRSDNQVKIRGVRIELGEIESEINEYLGISQTVVTVCGEGGEKRLAAYYILNSGQQKSATDLRAALLNKLPGNLVPHYYVEMEVFPVTSSGKLDRKALPLPDISQFLEGNYIAPETDLELFVADLWSKSLEVDKVGIHDDFFEVGGHSLLGVNMLNELSRSIELKIPVITLFEYSRLADFCVALEDLMTKAVQGISDEEADRLLKDA